MGQHLHAQRLGYACDTGTDFTDTDQPQGLTAQLATHQVFTRKPAFPAQAPVRFADTPRAIEHQPNRGLGHRLGVGARLVDDQHACAGAGFDIHRVETGAIGRDTQQVRQLAQQRLGHTPRSWEFVPRRRHLVHLAAAQRLQDDGRRLVTGNGLQHDIG
ncbi:hypothetical protein D3C79_330290 [compost metagenome]